MILREVSLRAGGALLFKSALLFALALHARGQEAPAPQAAGARAGAYERSLVLAGEAVASAPGDVELRRVLAGVHFRWGRFREASAVLLDILRVDPDNTHAISDLADCYAKLEDYPAAVEKYRKVIDSKSPQFAPLARRSLADLHLRNGRCVEAASEFQALLAEQGASADLLFQIGRALSSQAMALHVNSDARSEATRLDADAAAVLERATELAPTNAQAHYILAGIHRRQGKPDLAQRDMERFRSSRTKTPALDPAIAEKSEQHFEARTAIQLARVLFSSGDAQRAGKLSLHALRVDPDFTEAKAFQAWMYWRTQKGDDAARMYEEILVKEPNHAEALWNLGNIYLERRQMEQGVALVERAAQTKRPFPDAWELLARITSQQGNVDKAEEYARIALKQRPSRENYLMVAELLFSAGKAQECKAVIGEGLKRFPREPGLEAALQGLGEAK